MTDIAQIAKSLTRAQRGLLCGPVWRADDPSNPRNEPGIACDVGYSRTVQKALTDRGLASRQTNGDGTAWFYLNMLGLAVRAHIMEEEGRG